MNFLAKKNLLYTAYAYAVLTKDLSAMHEGN